MMYGVYTMKRKQIYIAPEQEEQLQRLAEHRKVNVSSLIREAVAVYLVDQDTPELGRAEDHPLWGILGIADSPGLPEDGSLNHDAALYGRPRP